jgi:hypothetical protein
VQSDWPWLLLGIILRERANATRGPACRLFPYERKGARQRQFDPKHLLRQMARLGFTAEIGYKPTKPLGAHAFWAGSEIGVGRLKNPDPMVQA